MISCTITGGYAQKGQMPVIAFWGVPDWSITDTAFRTFTECGFTVSLYPYTALGHLVTACQVADRNGIKIIGKCPEMFDNPHHTAAVLKKEKGFYGYMIQDEPSLHDIRKQHANILRLRDVDRSHVFYLNLLPFQRKEDGWVRSVPHADYPQPTMGSNGFPRYVTKSLAEEPMNSNYTMQAGDILLYRLK